MVNIAVERGSVTLFSFRWILGFCFCIPPFFHCLVLRMQCFISTTHPAPATHAVSFLSSTHLCSEVLAFNILHFLEMILLLLFPSPLFLSAPFQRLLNFPACSPGSQACQQQESESCQIFLSTHLVIWKLWRSPVSSYTEGINQLTFHLLLLNQVISELGYQVYLGCKDQMATVVLQTWHFPFSVFPVILLLVAKSPIHETYIS